VAAPLQNDNLSPLEISCYRSLLQPETVQTLRTGGKKNAPAS